MKYKDFLNLGIGETFFIEDTLLRVEKEITGCVNCFLKKSNMYECNNKEIERPHCNGKNRKDKTNVIFVEVENESLEIPYKYFRKFSR